MKRFITALVITTLAFLAHRTCAGNLLINGSFEWPPLPANTYVNLPIDSTELLGWAVGGTAGPALVNGVPQPWSISPADGSQRITFNSGELPGGGKIFQTFLTKPGHDYIVSFNVGKLGSGTGAELTAVVTSSGGTLLGLLAVPQSTNGFGPSSTLTFTATTTSSTLTFEDTSTSTDGVDVALDNVSVDPVPPELSIRVSFVDVCWQSFSNTLYQVQYRSDLTTNLWTDLGLPVEGTGLVVCYPDTVRDQPQKLYRVVELP